MSERLEAFLIAERVLGPATVRAAAARQRVYGGGLDTALLELGAISEAAIWARLAALTGLPVPEPALADGSQIAATPALPSERTADIRAVPVAEHAGTVKILCAEPVADADIRRAAAEQGLEAKLYIVPELRLYAMRQRVYGETLPQRYAPLLARAMGAAKARTRFIPPRGRKPAAPADASNSFDVSPSITPLPATRPPHATLETLLDSALTSHKRRTPTPVATPAAAPLETLIDSALTSHKRRTPTPATTSPEPATLETLLDSALTPLERVLDLSPPLAGDSTFEVEIEIGGEADRAAFADSRGIPIGLEMPSSDLDDYEAIPHAPSPSYAEMLADSTTEALCRRARDRTDKGRALALRALRRRIAHPRAREFLDELRESAAAANVDVARAAIDGLAELRDEGAVAILIDRLTEGPADVADAAQRALVVVTAQDFAAGEAWRTWWSENAQQPRAAWLLAALGHAQTTIRARAFEELRHLSGATFGYSPELPPRKREAARQRWVAWWQAQGAVGQAPEPDGAPRPPL